MKALEVLFDGGVVTFGPSFWIMEARSEVQHIYVLIVRRDCLG